MEPPDPTTFSMPGEVEDGGYRYSESSFQSFEIDGIREMPQEQWNLVSNPPEEIMQQEGTTVRPRPLLPLPYPETLNLLSPYSGDFVFPYAQPPNLVRCAEPPILQQDAEPPSSGNGFRPASSQPTKGLTCPYCEIQLNTPSEAKKHYARHIRPFKCDVPDCPRATNGFATVNDLHRHKRLHAAVHKDISFRCNLGECRGKLKDWQRKDNFRQHLRRKHNISEGTDLSRFQVNTQEKDDMLHGSGAVPPATHLEITGARRMSAGFMAATGPRTGLSETDGESGVVAARPHGMGTTFNTYTDSGYGTHGTRTIVCSSGYPPRERAEAVYEDDKDIRTVYSDTTSL
jgi:hypothetical protein